jgi:hypothetical protein
MAEETIPQTRPIVTLAEARAEGLARYFTGKPCKRGHVAERTVVSRACLECNTPEVLRERSRDYRARNPHKIKEQNDKHTKEYSAYHSKKSYQKHIEERREVARERARKKYYDNPEESIKKSVEWRRNNRDKVLPRIRAWQAQKKKNDPQYVLAMKIRHRINKVIRVQSRSSRPLKYIGCTRDALMEWLEGHMQPSMTWENYGVYWNIDHTIPLSDFDLADPEQYLKASHYTNVKPMTVADNVRKGGKKKPNPVKNGGSDFDVCFLER